MVMQGALSAYLRDTVGLFSDPLHGHSFSPVTLRLLSTVDRSLLCFRDCLLCHERLLAIMKSSNDKSKRMLSSAAFTVSIMFPTSVCQCLSCGKFAHRECLSVSHSHRQCRGHKSLMPPCSHAPPPADAILFPPPEATSQRIRFVKLTTQKKVRSKSIGKLPSFTLATLIEELNSSSVAARGATSVVLTEDGTTTQKKQQLPNFSRFAKKLAPVIAAGGVVGVMAMGPAAGVLAGLNMLVASVGAETVMAGIGLTASAAAAATATHQSNVKATQRRKERLRKGEWAMEICWNCKKNFDGAPSDEACRKDAEFLRRFQIFDSSLKVNDNSKDVVHDNLPDDAEVYRFLFGVFASPSEFLGKMNVQLCEAFRKRFGARHQKRRRRPSLTGNSIAIESDAARTMAKDTLQDTKMYVAHVLGATLQCFPSLASTPQALSSCSLAVERIVYADIHAMVFSEFQCIFEDADSSFADNVADIRREQKYHSSALLHHHVDDTSLSAVLDEDLQKAEAIMVAMMHKTSSPLLKLVLLCDAFRNICCFAEKLHQSTSNTDMLIPILCAFLVECPRVCGPGLNFVAEIAFISFFTNGGGKGVEGYVLTTFQASIQVIAAVDLPNGHAKELELFINDDESESTDEINDVFFDAVSSTIESQVHSS
ncbi:Vacuolar sorting protein 9 [Plasmopara halstedii]|uniref:Vacuolar sorting protein 9 n=1 Tax=Plasmopara halstedii TaxID=4781 RepID=A0A0P1ATG7_PLAHL|nr:Vacuolar sorting protein 9 [Plasmopara halstedii]CEG44282.1 Vacuolar sorting protein 9 [Plasmopara halstedii]|eukprot:XP_024580651.1 Vacuolar sorting protein 9 [Plasmopara halstedii]